ncbi:MAG: hypothetical protein B7X10_01490, partial [Burkholderiales bacterium 21-58-4]
MPPKRHKKRAGTFDAEFRFLLVVNPGLEGWRTWAAEYFAGVSAGQTSVVQATLTAFLVTYLHDLGLRNVSPEAFFARHGGLPALDNALGLNLINNNEKSCKKRYDESKHDIVSDFLDWILRQKLSVLDKDGHRVVPPHLTNPFPRTKPKRYGMASDLSFTHVLERNPKLEDWRSLATEWLSGQKRSVDARRIALEKFLIRYIHGQNLEYNYGRFLLRETEKPDFAKVLISSKSEGSQTLQTQDVKINNIIAEFLDWVLTAKLGDPETGIWDRSRFHNPFQRLTKAGLATNAQSDKASLSIRYIRELRSMLAEGRNFSDWTWAQQVMEDGNAGGQWFVVNPTLIDPEDPDCVARQRAATHYEREIKGYPFEVWELWSPVRAVALYIKLELPLRTSQI